MRLCMRALILLPSNMVGGVFGFCPVDIGQYGLTFRPLTEIPRLNGLGNVRSCSVQLQCAVAVCSQFPWPTTTLMIPLHNICCLFEVSLRARVFATVCLYLLHFSPISVLGMSVTSDVFRDLKYSLQSTNDVHNSDPIFIIKHHQS